MTHRFKYVSAKWRKSSRPKKSTRHIGRYICKYCKCDVHFDTLHKAWDHGLQRVCVQAYCRYCAVKYGLGQEAPPNYTPQIGVWANEYFPIGNDTFGYLPHSGTPVEHLQPESDYARLQQQMQYTTKIVR